MIYYDGISYIPSDKPINPVHPIILFEDIVRKLP